LEKSGRRSNETRKGLGRGSKVCGTAVSFVEEAGLEGSYRKETMVQVRARIQEATCLWAKKVGERKAAKGGTQQKGGKRS